MTIDFPTHLERFTRYSSGFLTQDDAHNFHIQLKIDHSLRVAELARSIVDAEGFPLPVAELTHLAALYHDMGRFTQFRDFGTFNDRISVNHARQGVLVLRQPPFLTDLPTADARRIRAAIGLHNARALCPRLKPPLSSMAKVVRDSDKLDILPVLIDHFSRTGDQSQVVVLNVKNHPTRYSESTLNTVLAGRVGSYETLEYVNDFKLLLISWVYDFNYPASFEILDRSGYLNTLFDTLPQTSPFLRLREAIDGLVKNHCRKP